MSTTGTQNLSSLTNWLTLEIETAAYISNFNLNFWYTNWQFFTGAFAMYIVSTYMLVWWYDELIVATNPDKTNALYITD